MQSTPTQDFEEQPVTYHAEDTTICYNVLLAGESQAFVGVGSIGKSNFARHLIREDVKATYIRNAPPHQNLFVLLDPHQLIHLEVNALEMCGSNWTGYELMLHRLNQSLIELDDYLEAKNLELENRRALDQTQPIKQAREQLAPLITSTENKWAHMYQPLNPLSLQSSVRRVEEAIQMVMDSDSKLRLIFVFDELEEFFRVLPATFFQSLRGIRDNYKRRLLFITLSRSSPFEMLEQVTDKEQNNALEGFVELLTDFTHYFRPLDQASLVYLMQKFEKRYGYRYEPYQHELLFSITGLHTGLIRRSYLPALEVLSKNPAISVDAFASAVVPYEKVRKECASIDNSLSEREQVALREIAHGRRSTDTITTNLLVRKHLLASNLTTIRIPLLAAYIRLVKS